MTTWLLAPLIAALALVALLCYKAYARRRLRRQVAAPREPGTPYLAGGAPVTLDRGRSRVCLLVHGYCGSPADFGPLAETLDEAGWDVRAPALPGFAKDPRELERVTAEDIVTCIVQELRALRGRYRTVALAGHSMGGAVACAAAEREAPDALVLVNPFLRLRYRPRFLLPVRTWYRLLGPLLPWIVQLPGSMPLRRREAEEHVVGRVQADTAHIRADGFADPHELEGGRVEVRLQIDAASVFEQHGPQATENLHRIGELPCPGNAFVTIAVAVGTE